MGAQPKRKITRSMQGKRRAGNTPKLAKDTNTNLVPMHKRAFFDKLMNWVNASAPKTTDAQKAEKATKKAEATQQTGMKAGPAATLKGVQALKKTARTQHKGG
jgi:hypothetical protein